MTPHEIEVLLRNEVLAYEAEAAKRFVALPLHPIAVTKKRDSLWVLRTNADSSIGSYVVVEVNPLTGEVLSSKVHWGVLIHADNRDHWFERLVTKVAGVIVGLLSIFK